VYLLDNKVFVIDAQCKHEDCHPIFGVKQNCTHLPNYRAPHPTILIAMSSSELAVTNFKNFPSVLIKVNKSYPCTCHEGIEGLAVLFHPFLTSTLGAGEWASSGSGHFTPNTQ